MPIFQSLDAYWPGLQVNDVKSHLHSFDEMTTFKGAVSPVCDVTLIGQKHILYIVQFQKNPYAPQGRSLEIPRGRGILKAKIFEAKYLAKLEFHEGGGGGCK